MGLSGVAEALDQIRDDLLTVVSTRCEARDFLGSGLGRPSSLFKAS